MKIPYSKKLPIVMRLPKPVRAMLPVQDNGLGGYKAEPYGVMNYIFMFIFTGMLGAMIYISETTPETVEYIHPVCESYMEGLGL